MQSCVSDTTECRLRVHWWTVGTLAYGMGVAVPAVADAATPGMDAA